MRDKQQVLSLKKLLCFCSDFKSLFVQMAIPVFTALLYDDVNLFGLFIGNVSENVLFNLIR